MKLKVRSKNKSISFTDRVWEATKLIPKGRVTTYSSLANFLKKPRAARAVGNALNKNYYIGIVPCHRVIKSSGNVGGYVLGVDSKMLKLKKEGIRIKDNKIDLKKYFFDFR